VSSGPKKKPELKRFGAGRHCPDCGQWVTGPEHRCPGNRYITFTKKNRYVTPPSRSRGRPSRSSSEAQYLEELEAKEGGRPAPAPPVRRKPLTEEEKKAGNKIKEAWVRRRGRKAAGKLLKAGKARGAIRKLGYDVDRKGGFSPAELKEEKDRAAYKHLEPDYIWEAIDPDHRLGFFLNKVFGEWLAKCHELRMSFWEYLETPPIKAREKRYHIIRYIDEKDLPGYKIWIKQREDQYGARLHQGRSDRDAAPFDTSDMMLLLYAQDRGWALYVQDMLGNIYSGPAIDLRPVGEGDEKKRDKEDRPTIFHHSSFLRGKPVRCAGEWMVVDGRLVCISMMTGHYKTKVPQFQEFLRYLASRGLNLKRIMVKWPWPAIPDGSKPPAGWVKYYRASDFADGETIVNYMVEPKKHGEPLERLALEWEPPAREKPVQINKPSTIEKDTGYGLLTHCSECDRLDHECNCGECSACDKTWDQCECWICSQCQKPDRACICD